MKRAMEWDRINFAPSRPEHHAKIAKMLGITMEELSKWRQETRQSTGISSSADKLDEDKSTNAEPRTLEVTTH